MIHTENIAILIALAGYPPLGIALWTIWKAYRRHVEETATQVISVMNDLAKAVEKLG